MYNIFMMEEVHTIFAGGQHQSVTKFVRYSPDGRLSDIKRIFEPKYPYEYLREHSPEKLGELEKRRFPAAADEFFGKECSPSVKGGMQKKEKVINFKSKIRS